MARCGGGSRGWLVGGLAGFGSGRLGGWLEGWVDGVLVDSDLCVPNNTLVLFGDSQLHSITNWSATLSVQTGKSTEVHPDVAAIGHNPPQVGICWPHNRVATNQNNAGNSVWMIG